MFKKRKQMTSLEYEVKTYIKEYFKEKKVVSEKKFWEDFEKDCMPHDSKGGYSNKVNEVFLLLIEEKFITVESMEGNKNIRYLF